MLRANLLSDFCRAADDYVLQRERRGLRDIARRRAPAACHEAAVGVESATGTIEPDGPPGAAALARALVALDRRAVCFTDVSAAQVLERWGRFPGEIVGVPRGFASRRPGAVRTLLAGHGVGLLVAIERCGRAADGRYYSMRGLDISEHTAELDALFTDEVPGIGIGDGGNEIGIGPLLEGESVPLPRHAVSVVPCRWPVIAATSNWGAFGILAELGRHLGRPLLPTVEDARRDLETLWELGVLDPLSPDGRAVDGFGLDDQEELLARLREHESHAATH